MGNFMNLKQMFGDEYVVTMDESWDSETTENRSEFRSKDDEWWYFEIKGKRGMVYPYSETDIAVVLPTRAARCLAKAMGSELVLIQRANDAASYRADIKHAPAIVRFIRPRRRRHFTAEQKAALAERLLPYRFQSPKSPQINPASSVILTPVLPGVTL